MIRSILFYQELVYAVNNNDRIDLTRIRKQFTSDEARAENNYALRTAAAQGRLEVIKYLIDAFGLTADDARDKNNCALIWAAAQGHLEVVKYLIDTFGLTADDARADNNYALIWAAAQGRLEVVKYLIDTFSLTADDARADNNYALRWAAENGHLEVVKYLRDAFGLTADDARDENNYALRGAAENGHLEVVKYLRDAFGLTATDARTADNYTLRWAAKKGHLEVVKYINSWITDPFESLLREESEAREAILALSDASVPDFYDGLEFYPCSSQQTNPTDGGDGTIHASVPAALESDCGICLCAMLHSVKSGGGDGEKNRGRVLLGGDEDRHGLAVTGCGHVFHARCVRSLTSASCPMCRGRDMVAPGNTLIVTPVANEPAVTFVDRVSAFVLERRQLQ